MHDFHLQFRYHHLISAASEEAARVEEAAKPTEAAVAEEAAESEEEAAANEKATSQGLFAWYQMPMNSVRGASSQ